MVCFRLEYLSIFEDPRVFSVLVEGRFHDSSASSEGR